MVSQDENIFQNIPKDINIIYWIPSICNMLKSKSEIGTAKAIIDIAKKEVRKIMVSISKAEEDEIKNKYILRMLPITNESEVFRNREMLCYEKSLQLLEEYMKQESEKKLTKAIRWYNQGEINGKKFIKSLEKIQNYQHVKNYSNIPVRYFY